MSRKQFVALKYLVLPLGILIGLLLVSLSMSMEYSGPKIWIPGCGAMTIGSGKPGEVLEGTFEIENVGGEPLTFQAQASCNCASLSPTDARINPGERQTMNVAVRLRKNGIDESVTIRITSNDPETPVQDFRVLAACPADFLIQPASIEFGNILVGSTSSRSVRVRSGRIPVTSVTANVKGKHLVAGLRKLSIDEVELTVHVLPSAPVGPFLGTVQLVSVGAESMLIPVSANICQPLHVAPQIILLPSKTDGPKEWICIVKRFDGEVLEPFSRVEAPDWIEVKEMSQDVASMRRLGLRVSGNEVHKDDHCTISVYFPGFEDPVEIVIRRLQ